MNADSKCDRPETYNGHTMITLQPNFLVFNVLEEKYMCISTCANQIR